MIEPIYFLAQLGVFHPHVLDLLVLLADLIKELGQLSLQLKEAFILILYASKQLPLLFFELVDLTLQLLFCELVLPNLLLLLGDFAPLHSQFILQLLYLELVGLELISYLFQLHV